MTLNTNSVQKLLHIGKTAEGAKEVLVLPKDSNLRFLPAYYFPPAEIVGKSEECAGIPRNPLEALESEHWRGIINSKVFLQLVMEGIACLAWKHIGVYAPKEAFSIDDPLYRWIYATPLLSKFNIQCSQKRMNGAKLMILAKVTPLSGMSDLGDVLSAHPTEKDRTCAI